jgi:hypothetical protein
MLTIHPLWSTRLLRFITEILLPFALLLAIQPLAHAQDDSDGPPHMAVLLQPQQEGDDYSYRQVNKAKTINIMLYGFTPTTGEQDTSVIPKDRKALNAFFRQHWETVKQDYLGGNTGTMKFVAGDDSITAPVNRGAGIEPAKMAGITVPVGKFTLGGGYTWGEKNPAYLMKTTDGLMVGAGYDTGRTGFQVSYLTSGQKVMGFEVGGSNIHYSSMMMGTSFRINDRIGLTATAQYRTDDDPLTTGTHQAIFTIGTKWKF